MAEHQANTRSISFREPGPKDWPAIEALGREMARRGRMSAREISDHMRKHKRPRPDSPYEIARLITLASAAVANEGRDTRTNKPRETRGDEARRRRLAAAEKELAEAGARMRAKAAAELDADRRRRRRLAAAEADLRRST